jgi:hypothetical protein
MSTPTPPVPPTPPTPAKPFVSDFVFTGLPGTPFNIERKAGGFGKPGSVSVGGTIVSLSSWTDQKIKGEIPKSAKMGPVVVTTEDGVTFKG